MALPAKPHIRTSTSLRFALLRTVCFFLFALLCTVPSTVVSVDCQIPGSESIYAAVTRLQRGKSYELRRIIYSYILYGFTLLHHFTSAFGPRHSLPNFIDIFLTVGETLLFAAQSASGPGSFIPRQKKFDSSDPESCLSFDCLGMTPGISAFTWVVAISLVVLTCIRIAETVKSNGRFILDRYDVTEDCAMSRRPNGLEVLLGVKVWKAYFTGKGRQLILFRGFMALVLLFAFNSLVDLAHPEADGLPVMTSFFAKEPTLWMSQDVYIVVGIPQSFGQDITNLSGIANGGVNVSGCHPIDSDIRFHQPQSDIHYTTFGNCTYSNPRLSLHISVNFTSIFGIEDHSSKVLVMIGHSKDVSAIIRHTEIPVVLTQGMNITGFARQHIVRQLKYPWLSVFGLFTSSDDLVVSEITQITPQSGLPSAMASLDIYPWLDFSNVKIVHDYRDKSILNRFSAVGRLWTIFSLIFGALYGSSLVGVMFGTRSLSIFGEPDIRKKYRRTNADMKNLGEKPDIGKEDSESTTQLTE